VHRVHRRRGRERTFDVVAGAPAVHAVHVADRGAALVSRIDAGEVDVVVLGLGDPANPLAADSLTDTVRAAAGRQPALPLLLYIPRLYATVVERLPDVLLPGLLVDVVLRPFDALMPALGRVLATPRPPPGIEPTLVHDYLGHVPRLARAFVAGAALTVARRFPRPERHTDRLERERRARERPVWELARRCDLEVRTLDRALRRAGCKPASEFVDTFRALDAARLIIAHHWSAGTVWKARGFADQAALTNLLKRCLGVTPRQLRDHSFEALRVVARARLLPG
jgi:AraC-like DNA-binding protein